MSSSRSEPSVNSHFPRDKAKTKGKIDRIRDARSHDEHEGSHTLSSGYSNESQTLVQCLFGDLNPNNSAQESRARAPGGERCCLHCGGVIARFS